MPQDVLRIVLRRRAWSYWFQRLYMNEHFRDDGQLRADDVLNGMGQFVAVMHCHLAIHEQIEINEEIQAQFANEALVSSPHTGDRSGQLPHLAFDACIRSTIQNLSQSRAQD